MRLSHFASAQIVFLLRQHDDGPAFRCLVGERSELRRVGKFLDLDARRGNEFGRHAVAERDRPGLVEQQHIHVARRLNGPAAGGEHVAAHQAVDPGDADGAQQAADGRRNQTDDQRQQHGDRRQHRADLTGGIFVVLGKRRQGDDHENEKRSQADQYDVERDFVRRFLAARAFDHRNHPVEERMSRLSGDADSDPVADDARATGDGAPVTAAFADNRCRLAGNRRFVHGGDAFHDLAVGGNRVARFTDKQIADLQFGTGDGDFLALDEFARHRFRAHSAQRIGVRLAAAFGHRLGEVGEQAGKPQPEADLRIEEGELVREKQEYGRHDRADPHDEHDQILDLVARMQLPERVDHRLHHQLRISDFDLCAHGGLLRKPDRPASGRARRLVRDTAPGRM